MRLTVVLASLLALLWPRDAIACSFFCGATLDPMAPAADAGGTPTNVQLIVAGPLEQNGDLAQLWLGRADGGDADAGVAFDTHFLSDAASFGFCRRAVRVSPRQELLPDTEYELAVVRPRDGGMRAPRGSFRFWTGSGRDDTPPPPASISQVVDLPAVCNDCVSPRPLPNGLALSFDPSGGAVWFAPRLSSFGTLGGMWGFRVRFNCPPLTGSLPPGDQTIDVIAFDAAWNQTLTTVNVSGQCTQTHPCTSRPLSETDAGAPVDAGVDPSQPPQTGCGCAQVPWGALTLLALSAFALRVRRYRP